MLNPVPPMLFAVL